MDDRFGILYLPLFEPGFRVQRRQKRGLRDALARYGRVVEIDWQAEVARRGLEGFLRRLQDVARDLRPGLVVCQFHDARVLRAEHVRRLRESVPGAVWVNWNGDYRGFSQYTEADVELASAFDVQLVVCYDAVEAYRRCGVRAAYWQVGWEPDGVGQEPRFLTPRHDVLFQANCYGQARLDLVKTLRDRGIRLGLYGRGWPMFWSRGSTRYDFRRGCRLIRAAKVVLSDSQWPEASGFVSNRLFQSLAAGGALAMQQYFQGYETLGFRDLEHLVIWQDVEDLLGKLEYWLRPERDEERRRIAETGRRFCLAHHSFDVRVRELFEILDRMGLFPGSGRFPKLRPLRETEPTPPGGVGHRSDSDSGAAGSPEVVRA